jgi:2'-hydroxyisoflavone reductase
LANAGTFDLVVDNLAFTPRHTLAVAGALEKVAAKYVVISSVSAYTGGRSNHWTRIPQNWNAHQMLGLIPDTTPNLGRPPTVFGKSGCEREELHGG